MRKRLAKTKNERLNYIEFRSFRHWEANRIAEISNGNVLTVMKLRGHRCVLNSMKYINIWKLPFKTETEYDYLAVTTPEELKVALLGGYQLVIEKFGASCLDVPNIFRSLAPKLLTVFRLLKCCVVSKNQLR